MKATTYKGPPKVMEDDDMNEKQYRIRRLTPREAWRLMEVSMMIVMRDRGEGVAARSRIHPSLWNAGSQKTQSAHPTPANSQKAIGRVWYNIVWM